MWTLLFRLAIETGGSGSAPPPVTPLLTDFILVATETRFAAVDRPDRFVTIPTPDRFTATD